MFPFYGLIPGTPYKYDDKPRSVGIYINYMLDRTRRMFEYEGLPETIPARMLELYLQCNGYGIGFELNNNIYFTHGGLGGEPDYNYMPTIATIANPALNYSANLEIHKNCVVVPNDSLYMGLMPMFERYATQLVETDITIKLALTNARMQKLISAQDDRTKESAQKYLNDIEAGKLGVIAETAFIEGLKINGGDTPHTNNFTDLIEMRNYSLASWYNEIGINANANMKREMLSTAEMQLNDTTLLPLIDDMLECRQAGIEEMNSMFETSISVKLSSAWEKEREKLEEMIEAIDTGSQMDEIEDDEIEENENLEDDEEKKEEPEIVELVDEINEKIDEIKEELKEEGNGNDTQTD